jgi:hypothetical protein
MFFAAVAAIAAAVLSLPASADEYVNGYYKSNGTYVQGYYRSSPDSSYNNNYSVSPNVNPYTGAVGTKKPTYDDKPPPPKTPTYQPLTTSPYGSGIGGACKSLYC